MKNKLSYLFLLVLALSSCRNRNEKVDTSKLLGRDYRLFQNAPAWDLAQATQDEDVDKIKELTTANKNLVNCQEPRFGQTLLHLAVETRKYKSVDALLQSKANPNSRDSLTGETPLMIAAKVRANDLSSDSRYLNILLKYGADPNMAQDKIYQNNLTLWTPLLVACLNGELDYVKILIKAGANINYRSKYGENALYSAIVSRNGDVVLYLLNNGVDYRQPMFKNMDNKNFFVLDALKMWHVQSGSDNEKKKIEIIKFMNDHGVKN